MGTYVRNILRLPTRFCYFSASCVLRSTDLNDIMCSFLNCNAWYMLIESFAGTRIDLKGVHMAVLGAR